MFYLKIGDHYLKKKLLNIIKNKNFEIYAFFTN